MVSGFHRDWDLSSVLNFLFHGEKTWHVVECEAVMPRHANLVLGERRDLIESVHADRMGYRIEQKANECVYLPGGYYHRVETNAFSLAFSMWWTWEQRLFEQRHFTDIWWLDQLKKQPTLKPERASTVEQAYAAWPALDRFVSHHLYKRYLNLCDRVNDRKLRRYKGESRRAMLRMRDLIQCGDFERAKLTSTTIDYDC
jgi:hypothetical protein|tara:strand:- start:913 stop:1509 length:597 start_codon:yes stop_codon:yes gene_type:complete